MFAYTKYFVHLVRVVKKFKIKQPRLLGRTQFWDPKIFSSFIFPYVYLTSAFRVSSFKD